MKQSEINELSTKDLNEKISQEINTMAKLKLGHSVSPLENPLKITGQRKTIARLKTELTKRNKAEAEGKTPEAKTEAKASKAKEPKAEAKKEKAAPKKVKKEKK